jgi:hypothetical protein
MYTS